jgi:hypothetical protein
VQYEEQKAGQGGKVERDAKLGGWPVGGDPLPLNDDDGGVLDSLWKSTHQGPEGRMKTASQIETTRKKKETIMLSCLGEDE